eukprot:2894379-Prymnesium_polylepis.1
MERAAASVKRAGARGRAIQVWREPSARRLPALLRPVNDLVVVTTLRTRRAGFTGRLAGTTSSAGRSRSRAPLSDLHRAAARLRAASIQTNGQMPSMFRGIT